MADIAYQTLAQFLEMPFGTRDSENRQKLLKSYGASTRPVTVSGYTTIENSYLIHLKIPSDSKEGVFYDVVIQFFTNDKALESGDSLADYYIQFFSNSPSFIYRYAVLYKQKGFMIDALQEKMDPKYANTLPSSSNKELKLTYDKSLFFACHFLHTKCQSTWLSKKYMKSKRQQNLNQFLDGITNYKGEKVQFNLYEIGNKFKKELEKDLKLINPKMTLAPKPETGRRAKTVTKIKKIVPKTNTFTDKSFGGMTLKPTQKAKVVGKKRPRTRTTRRGS